MLRLLRPALLLAVFVLLTLAIVPIKAHAQESASQPLGRALNALVSGYHERGAFDGVVLVARRGTTLYEAGFGLANRERQQANWPATPYPLCSITKQFTALLVMQEVARGHLRLDETVAAALPGAHEDIRRQITVQNLLTHTSGLVNLDDVLPPQGDVPGFYASRNPRLTDAAYVTQTYALRSLAGKPGAKFSYNNADYIVLAAILEHVTGQSYGTLLASRILKPLGMTHSGLLQHPVSSPQEARGYAQTPGKTLQAEPAYQRQNFGAAGAMYGTVDDLLRWDNALDADRLLPAKWREVMFSPVPTLGYEALGSWVYPAPLPGLVKPPMLVERDGAIGAFQLLSLRAPAEGVSIIIFANTDASDLGQIYARKGLAYDILSLLFPSQAPLSGKIAP